MNDLTPLFSENLILVATPSGPRGPAGPPGPQGPGGSVLGAFKPAVSSYTVLVGDGLIAVDLRVMACGIILPTTYTENIEVVIKDWYGAASDSRNVHAVGTVDGDPNPVLIAVAKGWARISFFASLHQWGLTG